MILMLDLFTKGFYIPSLDKDILKPQKDWFEWIYTSLKDNHDMQELSKLKNIDHGLIGTGDKFLSNNKEISYLKKLIPTQGR
ncbi:hypothetical protein OAX47_02105 [Prochlorococcus sp. AH-736-K09]|nr:hypothetical protein [Prochlorococcus sp. AH-736-K09]